jgi:hypothetical protein
MVSVYTFLAFLFLTSGALAKKCGEPGSETHLYCGYVLEQQPDSKYDQSWYLCEQLLITA